MNDTGAKKNTSDINNHPAFSKEIERIYETLVGATGTVNGRNILLEYGMLEWLGVFNVKSTILAVSGDAFRIKPITKTSQDELVILFANMIGGRNYGILRP